MVEPWSGKRHAPEKPECKGDTVPARKENGRTRKTEAMIMLAGMLSINPH